MVPKAALLGATLALGLSLPTQAHDIYSHLMDPLGGSCCNNQDCRPAPYRVTPGGVQMFVSGKWVTVPNDTIQYLLLPGDTGETGGGHWCGFDYEDVGGVYTRCAFLPPNFTSSTPVSIPLRSR